MTEPEFAIFMHLWGFISTTGGNGQIVIHTTRREVDTPYKFRCVTYSRFNPSVVVLSLGYTPPDAVRETFTGDDRFERCYNKLMEILDNDNSN